jgi:hypothetical protein
VSALQSAGRLRLHARADDQQPIGAQMHRRTQRRELTHRAIAVVVTIDTDRWKDERYRGARHQHVQVDRAPHAATAHPAPLLDAVDAFEECDRAAR